MECFSVFLFSLIYCLFFYLDCLLESLYQVLCPVEDFLCVHLVVGYILNVAWVISLVALSFIHFCTRIARLFLFFTLTFGYHYFCFFVWFRVAIMYHVVVLLCYFSYETRVCIECSRAITVVVPWYSLMYFLVGI